MNTCDGKTERLRKKSDLKSEEEFDGFGGMGSLQGKEEEEELKSVEQDVAFCLLVPYMRMQIYGFGCTC